MDRYITNITQLQSMLNAKVPMALKQAQKIVYDCIQESITEYYYELTPVAYERTYKLLNSLVKTDIVHFGNSWTCTVEIDRTYLDYQYNGRSYNNLPATGLDILEWNNNGGWHGGTVEGDVEIWNDAMYKLYSDGGIISILVDKLKKFGIPIK